MCTWRWCGRSRGALAAVAVGMLGAAAAGDTRGGSLMLQTYLLPEMNLPAQETDKPWCDVGGEQGAVAVLDFNVPLLKRLTVEADDLLAVALRLKVKKLTGQGGAAKLSFHRMLRKAGAAMPRAGTDYAAEPIVSAPLGGCVKNGWVVVGGFAGGLRKYVTGTWGDCGILVRLEGAGADVRLRCQGVGSPGSGYWSKNLPGLDVTIRRRENRYLFDWPVRPRKGVYCMMEGGRLMYGGKRLRLWGVCRGASHNPKQVERVKRMGFNAIRLWTVHGYGEASARRGVFDETKTEKLDRYVAEMKKHGMWIMCPSLMSDVCGIKTARKGLLADDSWLAGGEDWAQWKSAVTAKGAPLKFFYYFDERLMRMRKRHAANFLSHLNPHTGRRMGEEECIAMYEIWNENGFLKWTLERGFAQWPAYFRDKLRRQWNAWLTKRYGDEAGVRKAWGELAAGESLDGVTVGLAPLVTERREYPPQRAADFVRFMIETVNNSNEEFRAYCRTLAPKGVGVNVVPFSADTQYRNNMPWHFANAQTEVVCFGMYYHTMQSALRKPPSMGGLDTNTVAGRATVLYEVNCGKPNPYRVEFPLRLAALASWLDWDGVFFHYFQEPLWYWKTINPDEQYLLQALPYKYNSADVHFETDQVMCSSIAAAGQVFLQGFLPPAPAPVTYRAGAKAIFGYDSFGGVRMVADAFTRGAAVAFGPDRDEGITVAGKAPADRGPYVLHFPRELDYRLEGYDFAARKCLERTGKATNVVKDDGTGLFLAVLHVERREAEATVPVTATAKWPASASGSAPTAGGAKGADATGRLYHRSRACDGPTGPPRPTGSSATRSSPSPRSGPRRRAAEPSRSRCRG